MKIGIQVVFKRRWMCLFMFVLLISITVGCGSHHGVGEENRDHIHHLSNGDIQETTASIDILPSFLDGKGQLLQQSYRIAADHADVLEWIPCYCGCGTLTEHTNNYNCFIKEVKLDGSVVWDDHGTRCMVCIQTAMNSAQLHQQGMSLLEIRNYIDDTYKEGFPEPTPTAMPSSHHHQ